MADAPERMSVLQRGLWWAADYLYAGVRQLAFLRPPWRTDGHRPTPSSWDRGSTNMPEVVLVPGVYEHWTFLRPLGDALSAAGHRVRVVHGLGANRRAVVATSEQLGRALARLPEPAAGRVLVAHSKGGLIGKHLLVASGAAVPDAASGSRPLGLIGLVAVCTPFHGSALAALFFVPSIRAFRPQDATIVSLGREESINGRIVSIFGRFDPHIPGGSALEGATNVVVPGTGHFRVLGDVKTHAAVIDAVRLLSDPASVLR